MDGPDRLPVIDPAEGRVTGAASIAAILLAAGTSTRYGEANKLLATVGDDPVVHAAAQSLLAAEPDAAVAVLGHEADRVRAALNGLPFTVVENPDYCEGQATSVARGMTSIPAEVDAAVIALGDMPAIAPETVGMLVRTFRETGRSALAAGYEGRRGNPVLFDRTHFDRLAELTGDRGGRDILRTADDAAIVETGDPGVRLDLDERDDREAIAGLLAEREEATR